MNASTAPSSPDRPTEPRPTGRRIPTPATARYVARRPPALPWLCLGTVVLVVLAAIGATGLLIPAALAVIGTVLTARRWQAARALAARRNDQVHTGPGRHARPDEPVDPSALVPSQRAGSPASPPAAEPAAAPLAATEPAATEPAATEPAATAATERARGQASSDLTAGDDRPGRHRATFE